VRRFYISIIICFILAAWVIAGPGLKESSHQISFPRFDRLQFLLLPDSILKCGYSSVSPGINGQIQDIAITQAENSLLGISWARKMSGTKSVSLGRFVRATDGGFILAGGTESSTYGLNDGLGVKFNASGAVVWKKIYGSKKSEWFSDILQTKDGGYILVGSSNADNKNTYLWDGWVVKTNAWGTITWRKYLRHQYAEGALYDSNFRYVIQTSDGGYLIAGEAEYGGRGDELVLVKIDGLGNLVWEKLYESEDDDSCRGLVPTRDGGYLICCRSWGSGGTYINVRLLKVNSSGLPVWQKTYGKSRLDEATDLIVPKEGGFVFAGYTEQSSGWGDAWVVRLDDNGNITWQKRYRGTKDDWFYSIQQTTDGGYVAAGYTNSFSSTYDAWVVKLSATGSIQWQYRLDGNENELASSVRQLPDKKYVVVGTSRAEGGSSISKSFLYHLSSTGVSICPNHSVATKATILGAQVSVTSQQVTLKDHMVVYNTSKTYSQTAKLTVKDACLK